MKIKTLLYGGAFDPPHKNHINVALSALKHYTFGTLGTELWFLPCFSDAFGKKNLSDPKHRVAMLKGIYDYGKLNGLTSVCLDEIAMANRAGTYGVVKELIKKYPEREFYYVIGSDQAYNIREWRNSRDLLKTIPFIVVRRTGTINKKGMNWFLNSPHIWIENPTSAFILNKDSAYSSSEIRQSYHDCWEERMKDRHPGLLLHTHQYIHENNLYR